MRREWERERGNERPTSNVQHPISNEGHFVGWKSPYSGMKKMRNPPSPFRTIAREDGWKKIENGRGGRGDSAVAEGNGEREGGKRKGEVASA